MYYNRCLLFPEGQLPRGALYLDHKMNSKEAEKSYVSPHQICKSVFMELRPLTFRQIEGLLGPGANLHALGEEKEYIAPTG